MRAALAAFLVIHGLIHLLGAAKAFGWADLPQLTQPVSPAAGVVWFAAAGLFLSSAATLFLWPSGWWVIAALAVGVSTAAIIPSWTDAKAGALANAIVLVALRWRP
jgi:hypothetical protein